jgi:hypothetical protein
VICLEMVSRMELQMLGIDEEVTVNDVEAAGPDTVNADANTFTGHGLTCFRGTSAASLAFSVRICLHGPLISSTRERTSQGIMGSVRWCERDKRGKWGCIRYVL